MAPRKETKQDKILKIKEEATITNPSAVPIVFHEKKGMLLKLLVEKEMTIIDLKKETGLNPGTIKRHLEDLLQHGLIFITKEQINEYGIVMKFYRATAKKLIFKLTWPKEIG